MNDKTQKKPKRNQARKLTATLKEHFCSVLEATGQVTKAAQACGASRDAFYKCRQKDADFRADWDNAREMFIRGPLEDHVLNIAFNGYEEVKIKHEIVDGVEYAIEKTTLNRNFPQLAMRILERRHPDFMPREERVVSEVDVHKDDDLDVSQLSRDEAAELTRLLMKAAPKAA